MRKVTQQTVKAFVNGQSKRVANTTTDGETLELHGNVIARRLVDGSILATLAGYGTPTTRERLNGLTQELGLGSPFRQKQYKQFYGDLEIGSRDTVVLVGPPVVVEVEVSIGTITRDDIGRKVKRRDGQIVTIKIVDNTCWPVETEEDLYTINGRYSESRETELDLVEWVN